MARSRPVFALLGSLVLASLAAAEGRPPILVTDPSARTYRAAIQEFERARQVWTAGLISQEEFDRNKNALDEAEARRREAEARIALVRKQSPEIGRAHV